MSDYDCRPDEPSFIYKWYNTNKLLASKGFNGLKTGITEEIGRAHV